MKTRLLVIQMCLLAGLFFLSCSDDLASTGGGSDGDSDADTDSDTDGDTDGDTDADSDTDADADFPVCGEVTSDLTRVATRVMLLEDKSLSMEDDNKWNLAMDAIEGMVTDFDSDISFGLDLFAVDDNNDNCAVGDNAVLDVALGNAADILNELDNTGPSNATPLLLAMSNYTSADYATVFLDGAANSYLVIISDGMDTCGADGEFNRDGGASAQELSEITSTLLNDHGVRTIVIGFGAGADPDQLNAIAEAGGTQFNEYIAAGDGDELAAALQTIAQTVVVSCQFQVGTFDAADVNLDYVNVTFDGVAVPRDDDCASQTGWSWGNADRTTIQFCDEACTQLESETVEQIKVQVACNADDVVVIGVE